MKATNLELDHHIEMLKPFLKHRNKVGYIAARNLRLISNALTEYFQFKEELLRKYGDVSEDGDKISIFPDSERFEPFMEEMEPIKNIKQEVDIMMLKYDEIIGILSGEEILMLEWMLEE